MRNKSVENYMAIFRQALPGDGHFFLILDIRYQISEIGYWILDIGFGYRIWISDLDIGYWISDFGIWISDLGTTLSFLKGVLWKKGSVL
jgi:hypothetical protein